MTETEKNEIERRLTELGDAVLDQARAAERTHEAEWAYVKAEADLREFVLRRAETESQR